MAGRVKSPQISMEAVGEQILEGLRKQVVSPNLYAYRPHNKQYKFHTSDKKNKLYIGGNRSGKSVGGALETIYRLIGKHPYRNDLPPAPVRGRVHSVDFNYGVDVIIIPIIKQWLPPSYLKNGSWDDSYDGYRHILTLKNGSTLEFKSYEQDLDKFAGTSIHFNWYDEEPPHHIYNESQARLIDTQGDSYITMTPIEGMSWIFDDIYEPGINGEDPNIEVIEIEMTENPHLSKEAIADYLRTLDPEERKARERGEFVAMGGKIFKNFSPELHVIEPFVPPKDWEWYVSIDHGYNNPTAILWHAVSPKDEIVTFAEHYRSEMTVRQHAAEFHVKSAGFGRYPDIIVGDPAMAQRSGITGTSITQEYADAGLYVAPGNNDVDSGINRMIRYLNEGHWKITANCVSLIGEMKKLRWATYSSRKMQYRNNKQEKIHKKDDHACDSARYFFSMMPDLSPPHWGPDPVMVSQMASVKGTQASGSWDEILSMQLPKSSSWNTQISTDLTAMEYG